MVSPTSATRVTLDVTATNDDPFRLTVSDIFYYDLTVWCLTNASFMGTGNIITAPLGTNDVYYDRNGNIADLWFRNQGAGANTHIVAVATIPNEMTRKVLGLPLVD